MLILDSNTAVEIVLETANGKALKGLMEKDERVLCSHLFYAEIDSAIKEYARAGLVDNQQAHEYMEALVSLIDEFVDMRENYIEAFDEGMRHGHSTYDMFYLTLARRYGATLFTLDRRLIVLCEKLKIDCVHVVSLESEEKTS